jgi:hypothetical protein
VVRPRSCRVIYYCDTPALGIKHQLFDRVIDLLKLRSCKFNIIINIKNIIIGMINIIIFIIMNIANIIIDKFLKNIINIEK